MTKIIQGRSTPRRKPVAREVLTLLRYALPDVRILSERSAHLLEQAITALAEEARSQEALAAENPVDGASPPAAG